MDESCPRCGNRALVPGKCIDWHLGTATRFEPEGLRRLQLLRLRSGGVPLRQGFAVCPGCGLVWSELDPEHLRALIEHYGTEETKGLLPPPGATRPG
jgi:hypothetical protein